MKALQIRLEYLSDILSHSTNHLANLLGARRVYTFIPVLENIENSILNVSRLPLSLSNYILVRDSGYFYLCRIIHDGELRISCYLTLITYSKKPQHDCFLKPEEIRRIDRDIRFTSNCEAESLTILIE